LKDNEIIKTEDLIFDYTVFDENGDETGKNRILTDINLSIEKGSFVAVLGHNGSGKSTLAKHFNGILLPTSGKVLVDGTYYEAVAEDGLYIERGAVVEIVRAEGGLLYCRRAAGQA